MDPISLTANDSGERKGEDCPKHGPFVSTLYRIGSVERWSRCPECIEDEKAAQRDRELREQAERRQRAIEAAGRARYLEAMIPARFAGKTLDDYDMTNEGQVRAVKIARAYITRWSECLKVGRSLIFMGGPGTGKTHIAAAICTGVVTAGGSALFRTVPDAIAIVKASYSKGGDEDAAYRLLTEPDLLVLDDVGAVRLSDHDTGVLFRIINARYEAQRPMILTTNASSLDQLAGIIGDRLVDRLLENNGVELNFDWTSHRRKPTNGM